MLLSAIVNRKCIEDIFRYINNVSLSDIFDYLSQINEDEAFKPREALPIWVSYLKNMKKLNLLTDNNMDVLFPKSLHASHNKSLVLLKMHKDDVLKEQFTQNAERIETLLYDDGRYSIETIRTVDKFYDIANGLAIDTLIINKNQPELPMFLVVKDKMNNKPVCIIEFSEIDIINGKINSMKISNITGFGNVSFYNTWQKEFAPAVNLNLKKCLSEFFLQIMT
jgi:hypothetical protein